MRHAKPVLGLLLLILVAGAWAVYRRTLDGEIAVIHWTETYQTIDGFGGSAADFQDSLSPAQADFFFTTAGIGLSILRLQIIPDLATCNTYFQHGCSPATQQTLNGELETARLAVARGAIVVSAPWSPPGRYKSNGSFVKGGFLLPSHYSDWARDLAGYVTMMAQQGVPIYAVSVQNEPDLTTDYGSCRYTAQQVRDFVPYLSSALQSAAAGSTKIMIAEQSSWAIDLAAAAMADAKVAPEVGIVAAHGYSGTIQPYATGGARLWQTEDSSQSSTYDGSINDGLGWARTIHSYLVEASVNAWLWWFLTDMPRQGEGADNSALTDIKGNYPKRAYVTGQWSRFVRPGWRRIGVGYSGPLKITAFKDPANQAFAIVAVNSSWFPVRQRFSLSKFSTQAVSPWITSARLSLAPQNSVSVKSGGFSYTLPGSSVTTFAGTVPQTP